MDWLQGREEFSRCESSIGMGPARRSVIEDWIDYVEEENNHEEEQNHLKVDYSSVD
jgi:hypothetical protein